MFSFKVGRIGLDYRQTLYSSSTDETAPDYEDLKSACHKRSAERLLDLCRANGGCFVKVGQHIGALDYLLPEEYVSTMRVLHNNAPEMPLDELYEVFQEDMKEDVRENKFTMIGHAKAILNFSFPAPRTVFGV